MKFGQWLSCLAIGGRSNSYTAGVTAEMAMQCLNHICCASGEQRGALLVVANLAEVTFLAALAELFDPDRPAAVPFFALAARRCR